MGNKNSKKLKNKRGEGGGARVPKFQHDKRLGQNFLTDMETVYAIADGSGIGPDTLVIEIGPGEGVLTEALAEKAGHVTAIELDERLIPILRVKLYNKENVDIIHGDILETDLNVLIPELLARYELSEARIVGNLPYYITTPIIMKLLEERTPVTSITVMVQKEVGDRLAAAPGEKNTGAITYTVHYYSSVSEICDVDKSCFDPVPKVDSVVIRLDIRDEAPVKPKDPEKMFMLIKYGFMMRRKTLLNSLAAIPAYDKDAVARGLEAAGIDANRRAESLTLSEFAALSDVLATTPTGSSLPLS